MKKETVDFTLKDLLALFLPKLWIIILCGVLCAGAVGAYSAFLQKDTYTASTRIYVYMDRDNANASSAYYDSITSQKMVKTYGIVLKSGKVLDKVIDTLDDSEKYNLTAKNIASALVIKQIDETEVFDVFYTSYDRELTNKIIDGINIIAQTELKSIVKSEAAKVNIIDEMHAETPDSKYVVRNALIAFAVGIVISMIFIFVFNQFDIVIRNKKKIEDNFGIPVLGVIPKQSVSSRRSEGTSSEV